MVRRTRSVPLVVLLGLMIAGCGGQKSYHVFGTVTYKGKPVPTGQIVFEPDPTAGNKGQPAFAKIKDGRYDTREEGQGMLGGPHLVRIEGRDGIPRGELLNGLPLFREYNTTVDLPKSPGEQNFEVPADGAK